MKTCYVCYGDKGYFKSFLTQFDDLEESEITARAKRYKLGELVDDKTRENLLDVKNEGLECVAVVEIVLLVNLPIMNLIYPSEINDNVSAYMNILLNQCLPQIVDFIQKEGGCHDDLPVYEI